MIRLKLSLLIVYTVALFGLVISERICERQGTCKRCDGRGRFSYYTCQGDDDCFKEERCREGFCCPRINASILDDPAHRPFSSAFSDELSSSSSCPDGSSWMRLCKSDLDCIFDDEVCSLGKCCSSCIARRRQILREHPQEALVGYHVPECSEDGRFYQLKQCIHGFPGECFCVSLYGQRANPSGISGGDIICGNSIDDNSHKQQPPKSPYPEEPPTRSSNPFSATAATETLTQAQSDHFLTLGRNGFNNGQNPTTILCNDANKEFKPCLNACFVACDTRTKPQCPNVGRCNPGCQCKLPYILESSHDHNSRCVIASECSTSSPSSSLATIPMPPRREPLPTPGRVVYKPPIYPFSSDDGFDQFPHGAMGFGVDRSRQMHCIDPLKNFLTCGSACPPACGRFSPACSFQCVSGCFCRTPYVLSDVQNANSACILPQHCDIQGSFDRTTSPEFSFPSERTTTAGPAFTEELLTTSATTEPPLEPITVKSKSRPTSSTLAPITLLPPITCADKNKEFQNCGSSCPLACDNLDAQNCSPCVSGCFCKNGYVFESVKNWTDGACVKIEKCSSRQDSSSEDPFSATTSSPTSTTESSEPSQMAGIESIGAQLFTTDSHQEIGRFTFSTSVDQKIQLNARITFLPKAKSKTYVVAIHKYGALATDVKCEAIGDVIEINPVYSYPFPNGTLLYLRNAKLPYAASYTFKASNDFAEKSVGAVIGRSLALHELSNNGNLGEPLGCATVGILQS